MSRTIFITGTDTNAGKTYVTGLLAKYFSRKHDVAVVKPVESGAGQSAYSLELAYIKKIAPDVQAYNQYLLAQPLAPYLAAKLAGNKISMKYLHKEITRISAQHDITFIEGAGGLMVPLTDQHLVLDLIKTLAFPVILVVSNRLGAVNHTLLSLAALRVNKLKIAGVILNNCLRSSADSSLKTNGKLIEKFGKVKILAEVKYGQKEIKIRL